MTTDEVPDADGALHLAIAKNADAMWEDSWTWAVRERSEMPEQDYITDEGMAAIATLIARMAPEFALGHMQGHNRSVTATLEFPAPFFGPMSQVAALEDLLQAATLIKALYLNLAAERKARPGG